MTKHLSPSLFIPWLGVFVFFAAVHDLIAVEPLSVPDLVAAGDSLMKKEKWREAMTPFQTAINQHSRNDHSRQAEANYKIGICFERLGKDADAALAFLNVVAVYPTEVDWASRALERRIAIVSKAGKTDNPEAEYKFARRNSIVIQRNVKDSDFPDALQHVIEALPQLAEKLNLTAEQVSTIDRELGIEPENRAQQAETLKP